MSNLNVDDVFPTRLKQARKRAGLTQAALGVLAGIEEASASARMNQYERGVHEPEFGMVVRLAAVLNVPVSFLFEPDDSLAGVILAAGEIDAAKRKKVTAFIQGL